MHDEARAAWSSTVPRILDELARRWSLEVADPFEPGGQTAWVAPARSPTNDRLVLKIGWRHSEAMHEPDALREWDGDGAVRVFEVAEYDNTIAMVLERCVPGTTLAARPNVEQDRVISALLRRLWRHTASRSPFRPLHEMCDAWADEAQELLDRMKQIDAGMVSDGLHLFRTLPRTADHTVLLCTDLHADNVLAAERQPWLVIDPKPYVGDPTYDILQYMLNRRHRLVANPGQFVQQMADLLDLNAERLSLWLFARCIQEAPVWPDLVTVAQHIAPR